MHQSFAAGVAILLSIGMPVAAAETPKRGGTLTYMIPADAPPSFDGHREGTFATVHAVAPFYSDRDRGTPRGATPPTPPGIRVTYHGGSIGLGLQGRAFGCWLRHQWFGPLVIADRGFTPSNRFQGQ
jgi:hypothetical protein